jgi:hypothetical protein
MSENRLGQRNPVLENYYEEHAEESLLKELVMVAKN